jgi:Fe-Mn family superoxide dismutase
MHHSGILGRYRRCPTTTTAGGTEQARTGTPALLDFSFHTGDLRTYWSGNHTQSVAFGEPLLVMDMYEHAYQLDYGAAAAKYVDAFFANVRWDEVNRRFERAQRAAAAIRA